VNLAVQLMLSHIRMARARVWYLQDCLAVADARSRELKRQRDSLWSTLKQARKSRDSWKAKAQRYRDAAALDRRRARYWHEQRDIWKYRALRAEVELHPTPNGKGHLTRVSKAA
jgi:hypothetical protein